ncbi:MAG: response regulator [Actinomycetia bacterium]|nr:response regulator [Actinomycetes bacterium]
MDWQNDPELEKLFKDELDERSASLADGARAMMMDGEITSELSGRMLREGHTIKGTGRVMGYEGIARGGEACEFVWRFIQQGDLAPSSMLGRTLLMLAEAIPPALGGDDAEVSDAIDTVRTLIVDPDLLDALPEPLEPAAVSPEPEAVEPVSDPDAGPAVAIDEPLDDVEVHIETVEDEDEDAQPEIVTETDETDQIEVVITTEIESAASGSIDAPAAEPGAEEPTSESAAETPVEEVADTATEPQKLEIPDTTVDVVVDAPEEVAAEPSDDPPVQLDVEPLVFEPGPDGRLATPSITYEFVADSTPSGTPTMAGRATNGAFSPLEDPPTLTVFEGSRSVLDPDTNQAYDLGGLVGAVETWASEESVPVNAGRLFRMINDVATVRIDIDSAVKQASKVLSSAPRGTTAAAVEGVLESLESVRRASVQLESAALSLTVVPMSSVTSTLPQLVKYLSKKVERDVELVVEGEETLIDRQLLDRIGEVIRQLVVNAVTHGLEPKDVRAAEGKASVGRVRVAVSRNDQHLQLAISDDGAGVDWAVVRKKAIESGLVGDDPSADDLRSVLYSEGFSTNPESSEFTGSGSGLGRVIEIVEEVFGSMTLESERGRGTSLVITMPAHRALQRAQMFAAGGRTWGVPDSSVVEIAAVPDVSISVTEKGTSIGFKNETVPYSSFASLAGLEMEGMPSLIMVVQSPTGLIALAVDEVLGTHEVATKDLGPLLSGSSVVSGVALLGGDETVLLVDPGRIAERMRSTVVVSEGPVHKVLVVDDSQGVRQVVSGVLASHGFSTVAAGSVSDALAVLSRNDVDALVVDFSMPRADGVALVHMVRQRYGVIPIVMLSGVASEEDRSRAERAGVDAFFDKADFAKGALVETLRDLIETGESKSAVEADESVIAS